MDPTLQSQLMGYFNSDPVLVSTYNQLAAANGTGGRTAAEWMYDHIKEHGSETGDTTKFNNFVNHTGQYAPQSGGTETVPLEQDLLGRTVTDGYADWDNDAQRKAWAAGLMGQYAPLFAGARNTIGSVYDGSMLQGEYGANSEAQASQQAALATQMATRKAALDKAVGDLTAAQTPVNDARIKGADTSATAVSLGTQNAHDAIMADFAKDGYVGGSSGTDGALARASIAGRQQSAQLMADANNANASDNAGIARYGATEGRSLTDYGAGEGRSIDDSAAQRKLGFFSNDVNRRLANLSAPATLANNEFATQLSADNYGNTGFNRFMQNLQYFRTNAGGGAPSTQTYQPGVITNNSGDNLGGALLSLAGGIAQNQNYWSNPGVGSKTSYSNFLANNPTSSAAGGGGTVTIPKVDTGDF